jgi:hypothetical protein
VKRLSELALFIVGVAILAFGVWQMYHPAGYIILGVFLMLMAAISRGGKA